MLSRIQTAILRQLACQRDADCLEDVSMFRSDTDIFQNRQERLVKTALADGANLAAAGYQVKWLQQFPVIHTAQVSLHQSEAHLEWLASSDFRFFPVKPDETFGYLLHPVDLAIDKIMAAVGCREVRNLVDLVTIHDSILPLGAVICAAAEKSPGFNPEGLIARIRRNSNYPLSEWNALVVRGSLDPKEVLQRLRAALAEAEAFVAQMPTDLIGLLFLEGNKVVQPDPARLADYQTHAGQRRGHWPSSFEISAAMLRQSL